MISSKRGRKKKRGPKKKTPPKVYKPRNKWNYKVVSCRNGNQHMNGFFGAFNELKDAYAKVEKLLEESKKVVFPKKLVGTRGYDDCVDEYLILERKSGEGETTLLRNEFGKLVEHKTNTKKWVIFDKFRYYTEETFWVYGYDPKYSRKTFTWVYNNIVVGGISGKYDIKRVFVYQNKIIIKNDSSNIDIVFCKTRSEAIRFYNMLSDKVKEDNIQQVFFGGAFSGRGKRTESLIDELVEYTGWDREKVRKSGLKK